jgi:hypothetical protein
MSTDEEYVDAVALAAVATDIVVAASLPMQTLTVAMGWRLLRYDVYR